MKVKLTHIGVSNRPIDNMPRYIHTYFCEAENGAIDKVEDEDYIPDGVYELPDKDWIFNDTEEYGDDLVDERDIIKTMAVASEPVG